MRRVSEIKSFLFAIGNRQSLDYKVSVLCVHVRANECGAFTIDARCESKTRLFGRIN